MKAFLQNLASALYHEYGNELFKITLVFPNRRAGVFFQKYLAESAENSIFSPKIITIQELFESISDLKLADKVDLLVLFYEQYARISNTNESLDDFLYWGEMLLNDFSDIDKYLVDAKQLFKNINNLKLMDDEMSYLSEEQITAIRQFWDNFRHDKKNETKDKFMETWQILLDLYISFREMLSSKRLAYEGMIFREIAERTQTKDIFEIPSEQIIFIGLNALTPAEITLLEYLKTHDIADFYWDYESNLVKDKKNKASYWVESNLRRFPSKISISNGNNYASKKQVSVIGVPSAVGQAKIANQLINNLISEKNIEAPNIGLNTAIVLPDENLLLPILYSVPKEIEKINVTMGYSLQHSAVVSLISAIASMQLNTREEKDGVFIYYKFVLAILNHPLISKSIEKVTDELKSHIQKHNRVMVSIEELGRDKLLRHIFTPQNNWHEVSDYLRYILTALHKHLSTHQSDSDDNKEDTRAADIELEFIVQYYKSINRLEDSLNNVNNMSIDAYFRLLKQLSQSISISFKGEPLSGLQIMGILETRALDFENLIILSMNEGTFPLKRPSNSFIPYTLRKAFNMPTYEHQDSTYAYHFYRMISRAKRIFMLYDTRSEDMQTGEVSRYFHQMKYLYNDIFNIDEIMVNYNVSSPETKSVSVEKTDQIMMKMQKFLSGGDAFLSASSINNYINCPLQFYLSNVEDLSEENDVQESIEASTFGTIYHAVMQNIYDKYKNKTILPDTINSILNNTDYINNLIIDAFSEHYFMQKGERRKLTGHLYLISEIINDYVRQTLKYDKRLTPIKYIDSEYKFKIEYKVSNDITVNIKGSIDRIDIYKDKIRVIDYKTGKGDLRFSEIEDLFDDSKKDRKSHILQVFFYSLAYNSNNMPVSPGIYYLREIFNDNFDPRIINDKTHIDNVEYLMDEFKERLNVVITEIFDKSIPFRQTADESRCKWCTFKEVCRR